MFVTAKLLKMFPPLSPELILFAVAMQCDFRDNSEISSLRCKATEIFYTCLTQQFRRKSSWFLLCRASFVKTKEANNKTDELLQCNDLGSQRPPRNCRNGTEFDASEKAKNLVSYAAFV